MWLLSDQHAENAKHQIAGNSALGVLRCLDGTVKKLTPREQGYLNSHTSPEEEKLLEDLLETCKTYKEPPRISHFMTSGTHYPAKVSGLKLGVQIETKLRDLDNQTFDEIKKTLLSFKEEFGGSSLFWKLRKIMADYERKYVMQRDINEEKGDQRQYINKTFTTDSEKLEINKRDHEENSEFKENMSLHKMK